MLFKSLIFVLLLCISAAAGHSNSQPENVKILILSKYSLKEIRIVCKKGRLYLNDKTILLTNNKIKIKKENSKLSIYINNKKYYAEYIGLSTADFFVVKYKNKRKNIQRIYCGYLDIRILNNSLLIVNTMNAEKYIHAAATAESGNLLKMKPAADIDWKTELLTAMEIAVRSYISHYKDRHDSTDYDFCDLTHCVFFPGINPSDIDSISSGKVLLDEHGHILNAYFHSTCGGKLSGPEVYWKGINHGDCFRRDKDAIDKKIFCSKSPHYKWQIVLHQSDIEKITGYKNIQDIKLQYQQNRVANIDFIYGNHIHRRISISKFISMSGKNLGWNVIKSNLFTIKKIGKSFSIKGNGLGHGIGLCQYGAYEMAVNGATYKEILRFYYNNAKIYKMDD